MKYRFLILLATASLLHISCNDDDPVPENPEELITTLTIVFTPHSGGSSSTFQFRDLDGDGGSVPVVIADTLATQTEYHAILSLLNESMTPSEDITQEILDEDEAHQFFFTITGNGVEMVHTYDDMDSNGLPVGVVNNFITGIVGTGTLRVTLRHEPDKSAAGVSLGDITNAGGDTDIEIVFPLIIE